MGFDRISGNNRVREYLEYAFERGTVPHAFLISGAPGSGKHQLANLLARALVCTGEHPPCDVCLACKKAVRELHPDIFKLDLGAASIKVDDIRAIRQDAFIVPNDGPRKVYVIDHAERMTQEAQDALLKILEEPPEFTTFLLLCYNHSSLLPTVLSRVTHLKMHSCEETLLQEPNQEALAQAEAICKAIATRDELFILQALIACEKKKRDEMSDMLRLISPLLRDAICCSNGIEYRLLPQAGDYSDLLAQQCTVHELLTINQWIESADRLIAQNVGVSHIVAMLSVRIYDTLR